MKSARNDLTQDRLKELLSYDGNTGLFTSNVCRGRIKIGSIVGTKHNCGYVQLYIDRNLYLAHRLAWLYVHGNWPDGEIDHINGEPGDTRIKNLRDVSRVQNQQNRKLSENNKSGFNGVSFDSQKSKWRARIHVNKKKVCLGLYSCIDDAISARKEANVKYGYHENHGMR